VSDKYCPAGKIECEKYTSITSVGGETISICRAVCPTNLASDPNHVNLSSFEQCPWPSKQKKIKDKYHEAWALYGDPISFFNKEVESNQKHRFIQALKEAGL